MQISPNELSQSFLLISASYLYRLQDTQYELSLILGLMSEQYQYTH